MAVFPLETQRRVRLRFAEKFDLEPVLGEPIIVHVGEMPQVHQPRVVAFIETRDELNRAVKAVTGDRGVGEGAEDALKKLSQELLSEDTTYNAAKRIGVELAPKLIKAMQDMIAGALLDEHGDRMSDDDARALFEMIPSTPEGAALVQGMSNAALARLGKRSKGKEGEQAAPSGAAQLGK